MPKNFDDTDIVVTKQDGVVALNTASLEGQALSIDFFSAAFLHRLKTFGVKQDLARACGLHKQRDIRIIDITAGMGSDAVSLAYLGAHVTLIERNSMIFALLENAFERAKLISLRDSEVEQRLIKAFEQRLQLAAMQDGAAFLETIDDRSVDCIYIDPMFPERKKSAKVKKAMQYFHQIAGLDAEQEPMLLALALQKAFKRVVVKRPVAAPALTHISNISPNFSVKGKTVRYDVYLVA